MYEGRRRRVCAWCITVRSAPTMRGSRRGNEGTRALGSGDAARVAAASLPEPQFLICFSAKAVSKYGVWDG